MRTLWSCRRPHSLWLPKFMSRLSSSGSALWRNLQVVQGTRWLRLCWTLPGRCGFVRCTRCRTRVKCLWPLWTGRLTLRTGGFLFRWISWAGLTCWWGCFRSFARRLVWCWSCPRAWRWQSRSGCSTTHRWSTDLMILLQNLWTLHPWP